MKQEWTETQIREKLATNEKWVRHALLRLYERQTDVEQSTDTTRNLNLRGFMPCDAFMFTRFAKWLMANPTRTLSPKQLAYCGVATPGHDLRIRMWRGQPAICKYSKQMLKVIEEKANETV